MIEKCEIFQIFLKWVKVLILFPKLTNTEFDLQMILYVM